MTSIVVDGVNAALAVALTAWVVKDDGDTWKAVVDEVTDSLVGQAAEKGLSKLIRRVFHPKPTFDKALERAKKVVRFGYSKPENFDQFPQLVKDLFTELEEYIQECDNSPPHTGRRKRVAQSTKLDELVVALIDATNKSVPHVLTEANVLSKQTNSQLGGIHDTLLKILEQKGIPDDLSSAENTESDLKRVEDELLPLFEKSANDQHQLLIDLKSHFQRMSEIAEKQLEEQTRQNVVLDKHLQVQNDAQQKQLKMGEKQIECLQGVREAVEDVGRNFQREPSQMKKGAPDTLAETVQQANEPKNLNELQSYYHKDTRLWIFKAVEAWENDVKGHKVFALVGDAGIGKSVFTAQYIARQSGNENSSRQSQSLCSQLKNSLEDVVSAFTSCKLNRKRVLAYHFFDYQLGNISSLECLQSLCKQLTANLDGFENGFDGSIFPEKFENWNMKQWFTKLLVEPLHSIKQPNHRLVVVIDALDECEDGETFKKCIVDQWKQRMPSWISLFVTCRPNIINFYETEGEAARNGVTMIKTGNPKDVKEKNVIENMKDIKLILNDLLRDRFKEDVQKLNTVIDTIATKAEGLFLYLRFFQAELPSLTNDQLLDPKNLPQGIGQYYVMYFERLLKALGNDEEKYQATLGVVLCSRSPIPRALWMRAMGVTGDLDNANREDDEYEQFLKVENICRNLMHIPKNLDHPSHLGVSFIHKSMPDFLTGSRRNEETAFANEEKKLRVIVDKSVHEKLSTICAEYFDCSTVAGNYATRNLFYHRCRAEQKEKALSMLFELKSLLTWLEHSSSSDVFKDIEKELIPKIQETPETMADVKVVQKILQLGKSALSNRYESLQNSNTDVASELPSQILGRLDAKDVEKRGSLRKLYAEANKYNPGVEWLRPSSATLISALPSGVHY